MKKLITVCGPAHSGTTIAATILGAHPNIYLIPKETYWFSKEKWAYGDPRDSLDYLHSNVKQQHVLEKTPVHIRYVYDIVDFVEEAKFVITLRDPRDVVWSLYKRTNDWDKSLEETIRDFREASDLKSEQFPAYFMIYEDLIDNPQKIIADSCKHIGINFNKMMLHHHKFAPTWFKNVGGEHEKMRAKQVKQPLFDGRNQYLTNLSERQIMEIDFEIMPYAKHFGYNYISNV